MNWRFTIIKRNGDQVAIEEPEGFDRTVINLNRDSERHGVLFDYSENDYTFSGAAFRILKTEYEYWGVDGNCKLMIEWGCDGEYTETYTGKFLFAQWNEVKGEECKVRMPLETTSAVMLLQNKWEQEVNLQTTLAFDQTTILPTYNFLPKVISLPSKKILLQSWQKAKSHAEFNITNDFQFSIPVGQTHPTRTGAYEPELIDVKLDEVPGYRQYVIDDYRFPITPPNETASVFEYATDSTIEISSIFYRIRMKGRFKSTGSANREHYARMRIRKRAANGFFTVLHDGLISIGSGISNFNVLFDHNFSNTISISRGEGLYFDIWLSVIKFTTGTHDITIQLDDASEIYVSAESSYPASDAKLFLVHEAWNKVAQAVTNNELRVYSNYFGRTDSEPYSYVQDGPGSREAITKGLFIRGIEDLVASQPKVNAISMRQLWEGLNPVHNIGMAVETDPDRAGKERLRIEPWNYFYNDTVVLSCPLVTKVERAARITSVYSSFETGYQKWEAEQFNGLDEFLTKRKYRTTIDGHQNNLSILSKFIASGYAIEITRRQEKTSKDWRYDNEQFLICLKRSSGNLVVDLGNAINTANIFDPATLYNYRISPARNALRWLNRILGSYRTLDANSKIIFTDGDGNYVAEGELQNAFAKLESGVIGENEELSLTDLSLTSNGQPFLQADTLKVSYPMSVKEYRRVKQNPHGLIYWSTSEEEGYGWIDKLKYRPAEGMATFELLQKIET